MDGGQQPRTVHEDRDAQRRWLVAGAVLAALLFATTTLIAWWQDRAAAAAAARVDHTQGVLRAATELDAAILEMENVHRAWLVRGEDVLLEERERRFRDVQSRLAALQELTDDNPGQQAGLRRTAELLAQRHARMEAIVLLARTRGIDAARAEFRSQGTGSLQPLRDQLETVSASERALLAERGGLSAANAARRVWAMLAMSVFGLAILGATVRALLRSLHRSQRLHAELVEVEAMQRAMLDGAGKIVIALDPDGTVQLFNRAAANQLGWRPDEVIGQVTPLVFHDPGELAERAEVLSWEFGRPIDGVEILVARVRDGGVDDQEWTYVRRDGSRFPVQAAVTAIRDEAGRLFGFLALASDISRRQAVEREMRALNQAMQSTVQELESFSYSVSHDLRAPLRHIDGYARMLAEDLGPSLEPEPRRFLEQIGASSRRMGALIDDLLSLSRLGRKPLTRQRFDMTALVRDAWKEVVQDRSASIRFELEVLPDVQGDPALLRQVWLNLLSNAVKYSAPRGDGAVVEVSATCAPGTVTYHVRDNGVGFDPRFADKLFGVFQRLHAQDEFEGTGVGLAIVHRIVVRHGGNVFAESEPGLGARFSFELPDMDDE